MSNNSVFNASVCIIGILIFVIHVANILIKPEKRKDEKVLLGFFIFTAFHFAVYLAFTFVKIHSTSNACVIAFYTAFYIMNNLEVFILFDYAHKYIDISWRIHGAIQLGDL